MKNVLLVCGGKSYEHDISVVTAAQIFSKTKIDNVNLIFFYVSRDDRYFVYTNKKIELGDFSVSKFSERNKKFKEIVFVSSEKNKLFTKTRFGLKEYVDVSNSIICCHGGEGEDGRMVSFFENMGIKSTAGNFDSLAVCMNKYFFKQIMKGIKVPVVKGFKLKKGEFEKEFKKVKFKLDVLKFPVVVKPNCGGSSIGLFIAKTFEEFKESLTEVFEFDNDVLVEKFLPETREFNVAVIGCGEEVEVSDVDEPLKCNELLTFADKYLNGTGAKKSDDTKMSMASQNRNLPADISKELELKIKMTAEKVFKALNLCGVVRIDFLWQEQQNKLYVCEVNAVPGSLSYYFFNRGRFLINDFVLKLIDLSDKKFESGQTFKNEFVTEILN